MVAFKTDFDQQIQYIFDGPLLDLRISQVPSRKRVLSDGC